MEAPRGDEDIHKLDRRDLSAAREGDDFAYARIVRRHGPTLYRVLARMLRDEHAAEDSLQEVFVKAWRSLDRFDLNRPLFPWLRTIAVRSALNEMRRRKRHREISDPDDVLPLLADTARTDQPVTERELREAVESALQTLPPLWVAVFRLRVQEQLGYVEIAQALEIPLGTVMSSLSRARVRLARQLRGEIATDEEIHRNEEPGDE